MARKNIRTHRNDLFLAHVNCAGSGLFVVVPGGAYPRKPTTPATWGERCTTPRRTGQPTWRLIFMNPGTTRDKSMGKTIGKRTVLMVLGALLFTLPLHGQQTVSDAPSAPSPLSTPSITGPLQASAPVIFDGGPLGKLDLDGIVSGMGLWQGNHIPGDKDVYKRQAQTFSTIAERGKGKLPPSLAHPSPKTKPGRLHRRVDTPCSCPIQRCSPKSSSRNYCRHPSIRTLDERFLARCKVGVLVSAGAAT